MRIWGVSSQSLGQTMAKHNIPGPGDAEQAIQIAADVLAPSSAVDSDDVGWLGQLLVLLLSGRSPPRDPNVVCTAIRFAKGCVEVTSRNSSDDLYFREILADLRIMHLAQTPIHELSFLDQAIKDLEAVRHIMPTNYQESFNVLYNLQHLYKRRFEMSQNVKDIESVVDLSRVLIGMASLTGFQRSCLMHGLSEELHNQFKLTKDVSDLDRAVIEMESSVRATPPYHPHAINHHIAYGQILQARFDITGQLEDINNAIEIAERVLEATPEQDRERWNRLHQLGERFGDRFVQTGLLSDLDRAIDEIIKSIDATPREDPNRSGPLNCLAIWLGRRFSLRGSAEDLTVAVEKAHLAVEMTAPGHTRYGMNCNTLSNLLGERFARTQDPKIIDKAVKIAEAALNECNEDSPDRPCRLHALSEHLEARYERYGDPEDLKTAIEKAKSSVTSAPNDHLHLPVHLDAYAKLLEKKFITDGDHGDQTDLDEAIESSRRATTRIPSDHFHAAEVSGTLGKLLKRRHELFDNQEDYDEALQSFRQGWDCSNASPSVRIQAAGIAAELLAARFRWEECSLLLEKAVELLPMISPRSLDHVDKQYALGVFSGLASRAAASVLNYKKCPYDALKFLELGRNIIAGQILELRTDMPDLDKLNKGLADRFVKLRDELDVATTTGLDDSGHAPSAWEARNQRRQRVDQEFQEVIKEIRTYSQFEDFLLHPTAQEVQAAASQGPIVIVNCSPYRCDAIIVRPHHIQLLELNQLKLQDIKLKVKQLNRGGLRSVLSWSWDTIACPILTELGLTKPVSDDNWSRLWWVLTGPLSHIPIHAAGRYERGNLETVLDRVISSYASSVKSILYDRKQELRHATEHFKGKAVLISMPETPNHSPLRSTTSEIREVQLCCSALNLEDSTPATICKDDVLRDLRSCEIFHFAGHGISDPAEPSKSTLCLQDWQSNPLTVGDLRALKLQTTAPWLGYLSACSTSQVRTEELVDETIHLVSACQLAGFRHVVGTLWEVSDEWCVHAAKSFYRHLSQREITDFAIARALHLTVLEIRGQFTASTSGGEGHALMVSDALSSYDIPPDDGTRDSLDDEDLVSSERAGLRKTSESYGGGFHWVPYIHFGS